MRLCLCFPCCAEHAAVGCAVSAFTIFTGTLGFCWCLGAPCAQISNQECWCQDAGKKQGVHCSLQSQVSVLQCLLPEAGDGSSARSTARGLCERIDSAARPCTGFTAVACSEFSWWHDLEVLTSLVAAAFCGECLVCCCPLRGGGQPRWVFAGGSRQGAWTASLCVRCRTSHRHSWCLRHCSAMVLRRVRRAISKAQHMLHMCG